MAEREVILDRILRIELPQRGRDFIGGRPTRSPAIGQTEIATDAMNVRVDRDQEYGGGDGPKAEVDSIGRANHPTGVEHEALACAAGSRVADQVAQAATFGVAAKRIGKTGEAFAKISIARPMKAGERIAKASLVADQRTCTRQHRGEVLTPIDAVGEPPEPVAKLRLVGVFDDTCRFGPKSREHSVDASPGGHRVSKGEACRDQPDDLLVERLMIAVHEIDWVSPACRLCVTGREQSVQTFLDAVHFVEVLAILPSQLQ